MINLPGCSAPPVLITLVTSLLRWMQGEGTPPELDATGRPTFAYQIGL